MAPPTADAPEAPTGGLVIDSVLGAYVPGQLAESVDKPQIKLELWPYGTDLINGHRYYRIDCSVVAPVLNASWRVQARLQRLRQLHDRLKALLGDRYAEHFHPDARFASHSGSVPGTCVKLQNWLRRVALVVNKGALPEKAVEEVLRFFVAPSFEVGEVSDVPWAARGGLLAHDPDVAPAIIGKKLGGEQLGGGSIISESDRDARRAAAAQRAEERQQSSMARGMGDVSQVRRMQERAEKDELVGRINERYKQMRSEAPVGLFAMDASQLRQHLKGLQSGTDSVILQ